MRAFGAAYSAGMLWVGGPEGKEGGLVASRPTSSGKEGGSGAYLTYFRSHSSLVRDAFFFLEIWPSGQMDSDQGRRRKVNIMLYFLSVS